MRYFCVALALIGMAGCASAALVRTQLKPVKMGTVRLDQSGPDGEARAKLAAWRIMEAFCDPLRAEIIGTDTARESNGSVYVGFGVTSQTYNNSPLVHFECVNPESKADARVPANL